jgi:hypothetical protein
MVPVEEMRTGGYCGQLRVNISMRCFLLLTFVVIRSSNVLSKVLSLRRESILNTVSA